MKDRRVLVANQTSMGYGTKRYDVKYYGEWEEEELISAVDNGIFHIPTDEDLIPRHFGGYVHNYYSENKDSNIKRAEVAVYYD